MLEVFPASSQVRQQLLGRQRRRIDRLQLEMMADRRGLRLLVPNVQVLTPQLALEGHSARFQALGDLRIGAPELVPDVLRWVADRILGRADRPRAVVGEAVDELTIEVVEEKPVALQGFPEPTNKLLVEDLGLEAGRRSRPVVVV